MCVMETTHMTSSKSWFRTRYRIIQKINGYYQPQYRWWWLPLWVNISEDCFTSSYQSIHRAEAAIERCRNPVVKEYD